MKTRIISGAVLTVILVGAVLGGGTTMFILAAIITALGLYELYKVVGIEKKALGICGYILAASFIQCSGLISYSTLSIFVLPAVFLLCSYMYAALKQQEPNKRHFHSLEFIMWPFLFLIYTE